LKDTTIIIKTKEKATIYYFTPLGQARKIQGDTVYFYDSLTAIRLDLNVKSKRNYSNIDEWNFNKEDDYFGTYELVIDEADF
jgi:hypothetical protein